MMKRFPVKAAALGLTAMLLFASGCSEQQTETKAPYVKTQPAGQGEAKAVNTYSGTVRGRYETNMAFQVGGQILARNVQAGTRVRAGDILMIIDSRDVEQKANQGDAQVASARAQLNLAQSNLARYTELYQADAIPAAVLDQYQTNYDAAFAAYQNALAAAAQGHNALGYTNLVAGADGVVSAVNAEEGQVVAAGQNVLTLVQTGKLEVEVNVPENQVGALSEGTPVSNLWPKDSCGRRQQFAVGPADKGRLPNVPPNVLHSSRRMMGTSEVSIRRVTWSPRRCATAM